MMLRLVYYFAGIAMMGLVWLKHRARGYTTPTPFSASDPEKSTDQAVRIVGEWTAHLDRYCGIGWAGRDVLELGPGGTLGTGALVLAAGARSYEAIDKFPLARNVDGAFYAGLLENSERREEILAAARTADEPPLVYTVDPDFRLDRALDGRRFDRVVSCAAFEHLDDVSGTITQLSRVAKPGAVACIHVDFCTHSRWLRDTDPNNIYRYPDWLYWLLDFPGKPNRVRPDEYVEMFRREGWVDIDFYPVRFVPEDDGIAIGTGLARPFRRSGARMDVLSGAIMATRPA